MFETIREAVFKYSTWIIIIPFLIAFKNYKKYPVVLKIIFSYLALAFVTQIISYYLWQKKVNNLPVLHVYTVLEYLVLLFFYYSLPGKNIAKPVFIFLMIAFTLFALADAFLLESIFTFNTYSRTAEALIFIIFAIVYFLKMVTHTETGNPFASSYNYINFGFLLYFSGSMVLFAFSRYFQELAPAIRMNIWTINTLLVVLLYIFITLGLWKYRTK